jgi:uncharacterized protein YfaS (alpha-2-macroglobulin family)
MVVWATDIATGAPVANLPIQPLEIERGKDNIPQWTTHKEVRTNADGVAMINVPYIHCVQVGDPARYSLSCKEWHQLNTHRMIQYGWDYYAYVTTDRPIYRPGHTVYFSSIIRHVKEGRYFQPQDNDGDAVTGAVRVVDAEGQVIYGKDGVPVDAAGVVSGSFTLDPGEKTPRGTYTLTISIGGQQFSRYFYVASYRKPAFKVDMTAAPKEIINTDPITINIAAAYLFGMPLGKAGATLSIMTSTYNFRPEGYARYSFLDPDLVQKMTDENGEESYYSEYDYEDAEFTNDLTEASSQEEDPKKKGSTRKTEGFFKSGDGQKNKEVRVMLDDQGNTKFSRKPDLRKYPTSQILTVEASVQDLSLQQVSASEDVVVHKASFYLGIHPQKWSYGEHEEAALDVVSLTTKGKPLPNTPFTLQVLSRDYHSVEREVSSGHWEWIYAPKDTEVQTVTGTTDENGKATPTFTVPEGGEYRVVLKGSDAKGNAIQAATTVWAWGAGYVPWKLNDVQKLELVPDKDSYKVGETAKILIKSFVPTTKALLTLERGRMLDYKVINLGGSNAEHLEIPVTEGLIPNLYVTVVAQSGRTDGHAPMVLYGEAALRIEPESKRLTV